MTVNFISNPIYRATVSIPDVSVSVKTFRKPDFTVSPKFDKRDNYLVGDELSVETTSKYQTDDPLTGQLLTYRKTLSKAQHDPSSKC